MYMLMNLNRCSDDLAGEFINVDHMFYFNPLPRSGTLCSLCLCGETFVIHNASYSIYDTAYGPGDSH